MTNQKEIYIEPQIEIIEFIEDDIITTSGGLGQEEGDEF